MAQATSTTVANATGVNDDVVVPVALSEVANPIEMRKQEFSEKFASEIMWLFKRSVLTMTGLTIALAIVDAFFIHQGVIEPSERLVTETVVMAVIGATFVQVGAASIAIVSSLFRRNAEANADSAE